MRRIIATDLGVAGLVVIGLLSYSSKGQSQQVTDPETQAKILKGFQIAPVPLSMVGLDPNLVGLGSYLVNANSDCNGCHTAGQPPNFEFVAGGNPYFGQHPKKLDPATYLGGGQDFGPVGDPSNPGPDIISRNLTPDYTGLAVGGHTLAEFLQIIRTGIDLDHAHPTCSSTVTANCIPAPVDGELLQIMPWDYFQDMTDHDLQAMYAYLSAIPCIEGGPGEPPVRCTAGAKTMASASPKNLTVATRSFQLDGTKSTSADGRPLTYLWTLAQGSLPAAILQGTTSTPTVQFGLPRGIYTFQLTVTDSSGKSSIDFATVNFVGN